MSRIWRVTLVTAGAISLAVLTGLAQPAPAPQAGEPARRQGPPRLAPELNLTDAQRDAIRQLREEHRAATREQAQKLRDAQRQLHDELFADNPDEGKVGSLKHEIAELSQQLQARRFEQQERMSRVFTPEQRKLLRERRAAMRGRRQFRAERMRRPFMREFRMREFRQWY